MFYPPNQPPPFQFTFSPVHHQHVYQPKFTQLAVWSFVLGLCLFATVGIGFLAAIVFNLFFDPININGFHLFPGMAMLTVMILGVGGNILGIIIGNMGRVRVNRAPHLFQGKPLAIAGFVLNIIGVVFNGMIVIGFLMMLVTTVMDI